MKKTCCKILDTYGDFLAYWKKACQKGIDGQIELWRSSYMGKYPELLTKQVKSYGEMNVSWQEIAQKLFPQVPNKLRLMRKARENILDLCKTVCMKASEKLGLDFNITFVIYVGIGCGAGWATTYDAQAAVLLGLENIAEERWHGKNKLKGLLSHEIGHLVHMKWRNEWESFEQAELDPFFRLYSEGFAQRCEHLILGRETWHMAPDEEWLSWCRRHKRFLAKEFLKRLEKHAAMNDFFGSWFNILGKKQTGYFLGHAFICELKSSFNLREIALLSLEKVRKLGAEYLKSVADRAIE